MGAPIPSLERSGLVQKCVSGKDTRSQSRAQGKSRAVNTGVRGVNPNACSVFVNLWWMLPDRSWAFGSVWLSQPLLLFLQQLHGTAGSVDLRFLRAHAAGPGSALLFRHELRHLQGLPDPVGHPRTVDETGPPAVGEPCSSPSARTAGPTATASPWCCAPSPPGCAHATGRHTQPTPDGLPELICLVSVCNNSLAGLDSVNCRWIVGVTWLFAVLTVCQE